MEMHDTEKRVNVKGTNQQMLENSSQGKGFDLYRDPHWPFQMPFAAVVQSGTMKLCAESKERSAHGQHMEPKVFAVFTRAISGHTVKCTHSSERP